MQESRKREIQDLEKDNFTSDEGNQSDCSSIHIVKVILFFNRFCLNSVMVCGVFIFLFDHFFVKLERDVKFYIPEN